METVPSKIAKKNRNDMRIESDRRETFDGVFPFDINEAAKTGLQLRSDGFVACFFCLFVSVDWKSGENPIESHAAKFPDCKILTRQALDNVPAFTPINNYHLVKESIFQDYATEESRLKSFSKWDKNKKQTPSQLADAGFFYRGYMDKVICFQCGMSLTHWKEEDPWTEHAARTGKECRYVLMVKGEEYIERAIKIKEETSKEDDIQDTNNEKKIPREKPVQDRNIKRKTPREEPVQDTKPETSNYEKLNCDVCNANEKMMCSIPCGHVTTCDKCGVALTKCPRCEEEISGMVKLVFV